ncbi:MAG: ABC transporter substrate-binding protein [Phaeodactylibacter xiamenensis]|uniref:Iron ABC transporter n=1 Tax=Phaeodactylibacter xiamenensis TaxID=1524460 RepID=A0A098SCW2_9BACT|nr:helical backbone metal receptor [Phaeodactylibacter xiamenensis]KGE88822.1 iron ABC transporter [Phaeodactylibacter xiamenensis]MCR9053512.1 helical backbone metal receptor [bacterium]
MPPIVTDQMGRKVQLPAPPLRIVSLVPSQTELLAKLNLDKAVVGITKFCVHPEEWFRSKTRVGGTKEVKMDVIAGLSPNLIIGNKEENSPEDIRALEKDYPVWMSDIEDLEDALDMIRTVGLLTDRQPAAEELAGKINGAFIALGQQVQRLPPVSAAYLIWRKPYMVAARETFIDEMLQRAGFSNVFSRERRYPEVSLDAIAAREPEVILLSSEPYPFKEKHIAELQAACPTSDIQLVDGEFFSWYGSRLLQSPDYFRALRRR